MRNSNTLFLIEEALEKIQEFNHKRYIRDISIASQIARQRRKIPIFKLFLKINHILEKLGLHLTYRSVFEELANNSYDKMGKWSSIGTFQLALKNSEKFDEVYNLFSDKDSKVTFEWFIKYRVAYAFLGELAGEIFPPKIAKTEFLKKIKKSINTENYNFDSEPLETAQSWTFEQYYLKGGCEVSEGDYIIDGGAYKGETSFWFLSKGAGKVYAFEPDFYNFSVLSKNIKRNKLEGKIIPIQKALSNKIGTFFFHTTGSGGSTLFNGGNETIEGITLDYFVEKEGLERLDFIKLDVEGAELEILEGAVETIKKFKPKMAISVYHKPEDIITIPKFISEILIEANFYLSHKSFNWCETILFVNPREVNEG